MGRDQVSGGVSAPCWRTTPVANSPWKPLVIMLSSSVSMTYKTVRLSVATIFRIQANHIFGVRYLWSSSERYWDLDRTIYIFALLGNILIFVRFNFCHRWALIATSRVSCISFRDWILLVCFSWRYEATEGPRVNFVMLLYQNCTVLVTKYPLFNTKHPVIILRASLFGVTPPHVASSKIECQNFSHVYRSRKHWECKY